MAATQPTNPLVRIAELDTTLPGAGTPNKIVPVNSLLQQGYDKENKMFAQNINYIFDNIAQWVKYSQDRLSEMDVTIAELETQVERERVSIGEIIEITGDATNPSILKGYGTWESFGAGQVLVGTGTHIDDRVESKTWVDGESEGEYRHLQTIEEVATHTHTATTSSDTHSHPFSGTTSSNTHDHDMRGYATEGTNTGNQGGTGSYVTTDVGTESDTHSHTFSGTTSDDTHSHTVTVESSGGSTPMNNTQPSLAVYRWKRTA
ncbi:tail fiber protein [Vibrio phage 5P1c]